MLAILAETIMADSKMLNEAIERVRPAMMLIKIELDKADAQVITLRDAVKKLARENKLVLRETMHSMYLGTHPDNRYGDGVVPIDVYTLIGGIFTQGVSPKSLQDPTCSEMPPFGHPRHNKFRHSNEELVNGSGGLLPPFADMIRAVTLTCGHAPQGFLCFQHSMPCNDPRFSVDGKLSVRRLGEVQPVYLEAITTGVPWDCFTYQFEDAFPWISELFQEAGNAGQSIARCESRLEVCLKMRKIALRLSDDEGRLDETKWSRVIQEAQRSGSSFTKFKACVIS